MNEKTKIGVTYMTMNNEFYKSIHSEISRIADERGALVYVRDPELDEERQCQQIDDFCAQKVNVIVINPVKGDSQLILRALEKARKQGIKIIAVDTQLKNFKPDASIVSDNYQAGVLIAKELMKRSSSARILLLEHKGTISADTRIQGFKDTIEGHESYQIVSELETKGQTEIAMPTVRNFLQLEFKIDTLVALNDRSAIGALAAIKEKGISYPIAIYGIDGSPDMKSLLHSTDDVVGTVAQSPLQMGDRVMEVIQDIVDGKSYSEEVTIPVQMMTKENIDRFDVNGWQ
jgi:ribose ABC superfamily ATP binding cassette transporter, binding protein